MRPPQLPRNLTALDDLEDIETARQAADRIGVKEVTIWQWVRRGHLEPLNVGIRPMLFSGAAVDACATARNSERAAAVARAAERFQAP